MNKSFRYRINIFIIAICALLNSCYKPGHKLYFDIKEQTFRSCDDSPIRSLSIENDSITKKGFPFEGGLGLYWEGQAGEDIPKEINLAHIPNHYEFTKGGLKIKVKEYKLKPNCSYLVKKFGGGKPNFYIRIWTDSEGNVYRTSHPDCGLQSLENTETPANL